MINSLELIDRINHILVTETTISSSSRFTSLTPLVTRDISLISLTAILMDFSPLVNMIPSFTEGSHIFIATRAGYIKKIDSDQLQNIRSTGIRIVTLEEGDTVVAIEVIHEGERIAVVSEDAKIATFDPIHVRSMGRQARGVRSMRLPRGRSVLTAFAVSDADYIMSVSEKGIGKRTRSSEFPVHNRGTSGVFIFRENKRTGKLVSAISVREDDEVLILTRGEKSIRIAVKDIREISRVTSGVKLVDLDDDDIVVSVTRI